MREYLKKTLRQNVKIKENNDLYDRLPLAFKGRYDLFDVEINGIDWLAFQYKWDAVLDKFFLDIRGGRFKKYCTVKS